MAISPEQKSLKVVAVEATGLENLADSVMSLGPQAAVGELIAASAEIQNGRVGEDESAAGGEDADDRPFGTGDFHFTAHFQSGELSGRAGSDDHLVAAGIESPALGDRDIAANGKGRLPDAAELAAKGRHDPCVLPRAVPIVEAMTALVLVDHALRHQAQCGRNVAARKA